VSITRERLHYLAIISCKAVQSHCLISLTLPSFHCYSNFHCLVQFLLFVPFFKSVERIFQLLPWISHTATNWCLISSGFKGFQTVPAGKFLAQKPHLLRQIL